MTTRAGCSSSVTPGQPIGASRATARFRTTTSPPRPRRRLLGYPGRGLEMIHKLRLHKQARISSNPIVSTNLQQIDSEQRPKGAFFVHGRFPGLHLFVHKLTTAKRALLDHGWMPSIWSIALVNLQAKLFHVASVTGFKPFSSGFVSAHMVAICKPCEGDDFEV